MPKFNTQKCREYRERKRLKEGKTKKIAKSGAQRAREFRERQRLLKFALSTVSVLLDEGSPTEDSPRSDGVMFPEPSTNPGPSGHISYGQPEEQSPTSDQVEIHEDDNEMKQSREDQAPSESYCNTIILEPNDYKHSLPSTIPSHSSALLHRRRKQQRLGLDVMRKVHTHPLREEDEFSIMGRNIANKLRKLPLEKVPVVEKLITDVIFEAQCGNVTQSSRITFYDMRNASLRHPNMQPVPSPPPSRPASKPECPVPKPEGQNLPPNVVFLVPQAEGQKAIPLNVQMVSVTKPEGLNPKPSEQPIDPLAIVKQEDRSNGPE